MIPDDIIEKRSFKRIKHTQPVEFSIKEQNQFSGCVASNISESGIQLNLNDFIPLNCELVLQVQLNAHEVVNCLGRIVWIEKFSFSDRYRAGLEFVENDAIFDAKKIISHFISLHKQ